MIKNKTKKRKGLRIGLWVVMPAFLAALLCYIGLLQMEKKLLHLEEQTWVLVAQKEIPKGEQLTAENCKAFCEKVTVPNTILPDRVLRETDTLIQKQALYEISKGSILTDSMFAESNEEIKQMREPVIAGIKAEDPYQMAGGLLRAGDKVHIYCVTENETIPLSKNVSIQKVFDSAGIVIANEDKVTIAQRLNIYLEKEEVASFYHMLSKGSLRIAKVTEE